MTIGARGGAGAGGDPRLDSDAVKLDLEVVGHDAARAELRRLARIGATDGAGGEGAGGAHAFLLCGPEGVGRRHTARWFAALLNCREATASGTEPCGRCTSCRRFLEGDHPDYREVAAAATTGSGRRQRRPEIRIGQLVPRQGGDDDPLANWLERRPVERVRVGVIDGAETLNPSAANAFLKLLEEPPRWCRIVLIAPGPEALLPTVASRCTPVRFGPVDPERLARRWADLEGHPALRLGRPGALVRSAAERERFDEDRARADAFAEALVYDLERALQAADAFEKAWTNPAPFDPGELLRDALRRRYPQLRAVAEDAVDRCERALAAYASPALAVQRLALELRAALADTAPR